MIAFLAFIIVILDQSSKYLVIAYSRYLPLDVIKGVFSIGLVRNTGAAFGIFKDQTFFFIIVSILAVMLILIIASKRDNTPLVRLSLALILGGALGNLIDRVRFGYVVDFLDFKVWPLFNMADTAITLGAVFLFISIFWPVQAAAKAAGRRPPRVCRGDGKRKY